MKLPADFREFIELANSENVPFLVIGGWAFNRYAEPRFTGDINFFFANSPDTTAKLRRVLIAFGFGDALAGESDSLFQKKVIMLGRPPKRIDLITDIDGLSFEDAWSHRETEEIDGIKINFISLKDLIQNKKSTGREKDALDVNILSKLM